MSNPTFPQLRVLIFQQLKNAIPSLVEVLEGAWQVYGCAIGPAALAVSGREQHSLCSCPSSVVGAGVGAGPGVQAGFAPVDTAVESGAMGPVSVVGLVVMGPGLLGV